MSTDEATPEEPEDDIFEPEKKQRSPVERVIVYVLILGLLVIAGIEFRAQKGYQASLDGLNDFYTKNPDTELKLADAREMLKYSPSVVGPRDPKDGELKGREYYEFSWLSIFKSGEFVITISAEQDVDDPYIFGFKTPNPGEEKKVVAKSSGGDQSGGGMSSQEMSANIDDFNGGGGFGMGMGMGMGPPSTPRADPLVQFLDKDSDGELSDEEIENATTVLEGLDTNKDGELTLDEIEASSNNGPAPRQRPVLE
jgi:hypothetical protein